MKIRYNEDAEVVARLRAALLKRDLQCPCRFQKTEDNVCMCKEFREMDEGECCCGLYVKEKDPDESRADKV